MSSEVPAQQTHEEEVTRLSAAIATAKAAVDEVQKKLKEYDESHKVTETASAFLMAPINTARASLEILGNTAALIKDKSVEIPTKALSSALANVHAALAQITELAKTYDQKFALSSTVVACVTVPRDKAASALADASHYTASVAAAANAHLQGVNDGIRQRAISLASSSASLVFNAAAGLDHRFGIESRAVAMGTSVANTLQPIDARLHIVENASLVATKGLATAGSIDSVVTGGRVTPIVTSAYEAGLALATSGLSFVTTGYETAKYNLTEAKEK
jgi:phage shock protein A